MMLTPTPDPNPNRVLADLLNDTPAPPRYSLADVLAIIPKTKRSQIELLVRSNRIVPAWPSAGTGHERKFSAQNLFEISVAAELMSLGIVGERLSALFGSVIAEILNPKASAKANFILIRSEDGRQISTWLLTIEEMTQHLEVLFDSAHVLNARAILFTLRGRLQAFHQPKEN